MRARARHLLFAVPLVLATLAPATAQAAPGDYGVFSTKCDFSHANNDDPIVYPGVKGAAHRHHFFGNTTANSKTTTTTLTGGTSNCNRPEDRAAYWVPAMYQDGVELPFTAVHVYYRNGATLNKSATVPFPLGLRMIAGTAAHPKAPSGSRTAEWSCVGAPRVVSDEIPRSCAEKKVIATITFPSCWDGRNLTSSDQSHMTYPWQNKANPRACPKSHPVQLPELTEWVRYAPKTTDMTGLTLSSGSGSTMHADFWNAWDVDEQARLVEDCLLAGVICGTVANDAPY